MKIPSAEDGDGDLDKRVQEEAVENMTYLYQECDSFSAIKQAMIVRQGKIHDLEEVSRPWVP